MYRRNNVLETCNSETSHPYSHDRAGIATDLEVKLPTKKKKKKRTTPIQIYH